MSEEKPGGPCKNHDAEKAKYLTTAMTPHVGKPLTLSVAVHMFLCMDCGHPYSVFQEMPRGYAADGAIPPDLMDEIKRTQDERRIAAQVDAKVHQVIGQLQAQALAAAQQKQEDLKNAAGTAERRVQGASGRPGEDAGAAEAGGGSPG